LRKRRIRNYKEKPQMFHATKKKGEERNFESNSPDRISIYETGSNIRENYLARRL